jgi:dimethylaniline monooxygenase (N-oxide forming)
MRSCFGELDPNWSLEPAPSLKVSVPVVSDSLIDSLRNGSVRMVSGIRRIIGPKEVEMVNGERIMVDSIICCTGYHKNFNILDPRYDPSGHPTPAWREAPGSKGRPLARLYQNVFSLEAPNSLAFLGCAWFATGAFFLADIASMCIAQVWAGKSPLPPPPEMDAWADAQERRICELAHRGTPIPASVPQREWLAWADQVAGIGLSDRLGWGSKGWEFWFKNRALYQLLLDGVMTSSMWRLFDEGKRKPWDGAAEQIRRLNDEVEREKAMTGAKNNWYISWWGA